MNLFDNMHGLKGCIRCLTFKNVLLAHFLLAFSVAGSVSAEALPTSYSLIPQHFDLTLFIST